MRPHLGSEHVILCFEALRTVPVSVSVHNTRSPFLRVIDQLDGSLQGLPGFVDDAVSDLQREVMNTDVTVLQKCLCHAG